MTSDGPVARPELPPDVLPAAAETQIFAEKLGIDSNLMAAEKLREALPNGWCACRADSGEVYYHCGLSGKSQWTHPGRSWDTLQSCVREKEIHRFQRGDSSMVELMMKAVQRRRGQGHGQKEPASSVKSPLETFQAPHSVYDARSRHVPLGAPATLLCDAATKVTREDLQERTFLLHGLLSPEEAASYVQSAEATGFRDSDVEREFPAEVRNNSRLVHFSDVLADALWRRLAPSLMHKDIYLMQPMGFGSEGRWKPIGVNPCFRISRYSAGEHFAAHHDGMYVNDDGDCSIYSLILYLNDDFDGGELQLLEPLKCKFKPRAGSAAFFPHDKLHEAGKVRKGTKYVMRSEIMFRCVYAGPPPRQHNIVTDPLFQKMCALYEQVGDLAHLGDAEKTTATYQEALGIQIAHQGTLSKEVVSPLPLRTEMLALALAFLGPTQVLSSASVSLGWLHVTQQGRLWESQYQQRWPRSCEVMGDVTHKLDPEVRDWQGLYRKAHFLEASKSACTIFLTSLIHAQTVGEKPCQAVEAQAGHEPLQIGWDAYLKQRGGWRVGPASTMTYGVRQTTKSYSWLDGREVNWNVLPVLFRWAFQKLRRRPSEQRLVLPALPGVWEKSSRARLAKILAGRFEVPSLCVVPAPLCALLAHGLRTGTVVWGCCKGKALVLCYKNASLVASSSTLQFGSVQAKEVASRVIQVAATLEHKGMAEEVLGNLVFSTQEGAEEKTAAWPAAEDVKAELQLLLDGVIEKQRCILKSAVFYGPLSDDVLLGAESLAGSEDVKLFEVLPQETSRWEWRWFDDQNWQKLPSYVAGVFEGAFRDGQERASVRGLYYSEIVADFNDWTVRLNQRPVSHFKLTRFLRGRPSAKPDLREPADLEPAAALEAAEVESVPGSALQVRTLSGKLVLSMARASLQCLAFQDLLQDLGDNLGVSAKRLRLLSGGVELTSLTGLEALGSEDRGEESIELLALVDPEQEDEFDSDFDKIPEHIPGEVGIYN